MTSRLAYTGGAMFVLTVEGVRRRVPAGACRIGPHSAPRRFCSVSWRCIVQFA